MTEEEFLKALPVDILIEANWETREVYIDGKWLNIKRSQSVIMKSVEFAWGYGGSGPAQLALAILLRYVDRKTALKYYHDLKFAWLGGLPQADIEGAFNLREIMTAYLLKRKRG